VNPEQAARLLYMADKLEAAMGRTLAQRPGLVGSHWEIEYREDIQFLRLLAEGG
jgi:hypothetical protein